VQHVLLAFEFARKQKPEQSREKEKCLTYSSFIVFGLVYPDGFWQVFEVLVPGEDFALVYSGCGVYNAVE
jgi:hypothetical protein